MTEFRAVNNYTRATGEGLQEKIDLAMTDAVLDMQFTHYLGDFVDDKGFLQASYQAALLVEKKKALKQAREQIKGQTGGTGGLVWEEKKKEEKRPGIRKKTGVRKNPGTGQGAVTQHSSWGQPGRWATKEDALKGVPSQEHEEYFRSPEICWRCGQKGHRAYECFAHTTRQGTTLPKAA